MINDSGKKDRKFGIVIQ
ncbi:hypothetical protein AZE42_11412 [Rhizopogon vesiculosus]|uniref:Uncharacterized protein n=1 Tax=Rhizopogon vesiculosus TaxID=180088 RepID=A0A1J8PV82_9AGAM|nr:hypothetical protein AZE42_11412 [Rhizopogon vesiculosus]